MEKPVFGVLLADGAGHCPATVRANEQRSAEALAGGGLRSFARMGGGTRCPGRRPRAAKVWRLDTPAVCSPLGRISNPHAVYCHYPENIFPLLLPGYLTGSSGSSNDSGCYLRGIALRDAPIEGPLPELCSDKDPKVRRRLAAGPDDRNLRRWCVAVAPDPINNRFLMAEATMAMGKNVVAERGMLATVGGWMLRCTTLPRRRLRFACHRHFEILAVLGCAAVTLAPIFAAACRGEFIVDFAQSGANVVATGNGTINLAALSSDSYMDELPGEHAALANAWLGDWTGNEPVYTGLSGPQAFGTGAFFNGSAGYGTAVAIEGKDEMLQVPYGYVSGSSLSDTTTWDGTTISGMGLTPGTYTWTWGTGPTADSFVIEVTNVPEPPSLVLACSALPGLAAVVFLRRRRAKV